MFDIAKARRETRHCESLIHFNNAGASLMPIPVSDYLHDYLHQEEREGGYETADRREGDLNNFYRAGATLLNCSADEIAFAENATRAWDMAFYSLRFQPGDKILTTISEYGSNVVAYLQQARRCGAEVVYVPNDEAGQLDVAALESLIDDRVKLISLNYIPTGGGLVNPAGAVGRIAKQTGIPYLLDACQALGQVPVDVEELGCDMLSGAGRKFLRGPRGTGLLYVRRSWINRLEPPMLDQCAAELLSPVDFRIRDDAKRFESWEQFAAGKAALGVAIDYALSWGLPAIRERVFALAALLREKLAAIDGIVVTDDGVEKCGIVTFYATWKTPPEIQQALAQQQVNVTCTAGPGNLVSYIDRGLTDMVRASLHYYNTEAEIGQVVDMLRGMARS